MNQEITGMRARKWDYLNRIVASFGEIYNYDLMRMKQPDIFASIKDFAKHESNAKIYYNQTFFKEETYSEFGMFQLGANPFLAETISLGVRMLETMGFNSIKVQLKEENKILENDLDNFDIDYEIKSDLNHENWTGNQFQIIVEKEDLKNQNCFIVGGECEKEKIAGFTANMDHILDAIDLLELKLVDEKVLDCIVTYQTDSEKERAIYLTQELRLNGFASEMASESELLAKYTLFIKEELFSTDEIILKDNLTNETETIKEMDLVGHLDINI